MCFTVFVSSSFVSFQSGVILNTGVVRRRHGEKIAALSDNGCPMHFLAARRRIETLIVPMAR
jgi:hypothetical protein